MDYPLAYYSYFHQTETVNTHDNSLVYLIGGLIFILIILIINSFISERRLDRLERIQEVLMLNDRTKEV